ncbi:MAG TPA: DUF5908 family protein [Burkholderiales bacterium]|jgi:hypothetical protein
MPVVVDEIVISVEVASPQAAAAAPAGAEAQPQDRHALVSECVERVLDVLRRKEER